MKKSTKTMMSLAMITGAGIVGWMYYKKKNPNALEDMKCMAGNMANSIAQKLEEE